MSIRLRYSLALLLVVGAPLATDATEGDGTRSPVCLEKRTLTGQYYCDGINVGDFDRDGHMDIVAGPFWYAGPDFTTQHEIYPANPFETAPGPTNSLYTFVHDFNRDGWPDILVLGRVHLHSGFWYDKRTS